MRQTIACLILGMLLALEGYKFIMTLGATLAALPLILILYLLYKLGTVNEKKDTENKDDIEDKPK